VEQRDAFRALVRLADPDLLILDEVDGRHVPADLTAALRGIRGDADTVWHATIGTGGGYQRGSVVSREPVEAVDELALVAYPDTAAAQVLGLAPDSLHQRLRRNLAGGLPVHGAILRAGGRRLLAVSLDLQCCGVAGSWEDERRLVEARLVRDALERALRRRPVDGVLAAGDLNLVGTATPLVILMGPYDPPRVHLVPAEAYHRDGRTTWTWDGRGTEFPSKPLDFQLHTSGSLDRVAAVVLDTRDLTPAELAALGIDAAASRRVSDHLPVVVDYRWR
jgi:endonuclease/exonuclease/phosphatase family metal-dependent hydrolase